MPPARLERATFRLGEEYSSFLIKFQAITIQSFSVLHPSLAGKFSILDFSQILLNTHA